MKISFFTACMNRSEHLKQTLLRNLDDNSDCDDLEYVVLNYNSRDDMEEWIKDNCSQHIQQGRLVYYREKSAQYYSHLANNTAARLCSGEVICCILADIFTHRGFASYVAKKLRDKHRSFIRYNEISGAAGVICVRKRHFLELGGYDESFEGWGADDGNLAYRLIAYGLELIPMDKQFCSHLKHSDELRVENFKVKEKKLLSNVKTTLENISRGNIIANRENGFGLATVYRNFNEHEPITLTRETRKPDWRFRVSRAVRSFLNRARFQ
jgi:hypothetical protein